MKKSRFKRVISQALNNKAKKIGCIVHYDSGYWLTSEGTVILFDTKHLNIRKKISSIEEKLNDYERRIA